MRCRIISIRSADLTCFLFGGYLLRRSACGTRLVGIDPGSSSLSPVGRYRQWGVIASGLGNKKTQAASIHFPRKNLGQES